MCTATTDGEYGFVMAVTADDESHAHGGPFLHSTTPQSTLFFFNINERVWRYGEWRAFQLIHFINVMVFFAFMFFYTAYYRDREIFGSEMYERK